MSLIFRYLTLILSKVQPNSEKPLPQLNEEPADNWMCLFCLNSAELIQTSPGSREPPKISKTCSTHPSIGRHCRLRIEGQSWNGHYCTWVKLLQSCFLLPDTLNHQQGFHPLALLQTLKCANYTF